MAEQEAQEREKRMIQFKLYLYRECTRAKQEGLIWMTNPHNANKELHFDYLDEIPGKIREHLRLIGRAYDVADQSDNTVIAPKVRKSKVVRKIRLTDTKSSLA
jgi:hypothetical protein